MDPKHISQALLTWFLCIIFVIWRRKISPNHILGHICGHPNNKNTWEFNHFLWSVKKRVCALFSDSFWTVIIVSTSLSFIWGGGMAPNTHIKLYLPFPMTKSPGRMNIFMYFPWLNEPYFWTVFRKLLWFLKVVNKKIAATHIIGTLALPGNTHVRESSFLMHF
jgi:hypothetical protein